MAEVEALCPSCICATVGVCHGGFELCFPWSLALGCTTCHFTWYACTRKGCLIPTPKNVFTKRRQLKDHARRWHSRPEPLLTPSPEQLIQPVCASVPLYMPADNDTSDVDSFSMSISDNVIVLPTWSFADIRTEQFADWCIATNVTSALNCLVQQALLQSPVSIHMDTSSQLNQTTVDIFLSMSKLIINTGNEQHRSVASMVSLLSGLIPESSQPWPTMPASLPAFQSHILNPSNKRSLVSLLPGAQVNMIDNVHAYCCLEEIIAFVLLLPRSNAMSPIPIRLRRLCMSKDMQEFMHPLHPISPECHVSIGILFWMDGWDPSASSKNNRTPIHTASATLLLIDNYSHLLFDCRTYPITCGPGKVDHNIIFDAITTSLANLTTSKHQMWSHYHNHCTTLRCHVIAMLMDQPEHRSSTCLLGGNGKQHPLFGVSCNFSELALPFTACSTCLAVANKFLSSQKFHDRIVFDCIDCYSYSLHRLLTVGKRNEPMLPWLSPDAPGQGLADQPGTISMSLLLDGWQYAIRKNGDRTRMGTKGGGCIFQPTMHQQIHH